MLRVGLYLGGHIFGSDVRQFVELARIADDVGLDDVSLGEHLVMGTQHPTPPWGSFVHHLDEPFPEPLTTLAMIAGATRHVRLISSILIAPLRPAVFLAKQAATLHVLSDGRLVLGISTSWHADEYAALGVPFDRRAQYLDDIVGACRALWGKQPASFRSPTVTFSDIYCLPRPAEVDDIPLWFTGKMRKQLVRRVAKYGHGWLPWIGADTPLPPLADDIAVIKQAMADEGRDPSRLEVSVRFRSMGRSLEQAFEEDAPLMVRTGITQTYVPLLSLAPSLAEAPKAVERIGRLAERYRS
ncbi:MAG: TIGR03619 family F420-dependent LLM class oxidoreductase [Chloroflexi bacterium]|nr:TIGR03619 family F420-dependent LLM class oxidoreductase [Chloroflexota bacterium]